MIKLIKILKANIGYVIENILFAFMALAVPYAGATIYVMIRVSQTHKEPCPWGTISALAIGIAILLGAFFWKTVLNNRE